MLLFLKPQFSQIYLFVLLSFCVSNVFAAMDPRFELDTVTLSGSVVKTEKLPNRAVKQRTHRRDLAGAASGDVYTVKRGDNIFKILMRDYNLSNDDAESFVEDIKRENNIYDIRRLKVGSKIIIPPLRRNSDGSIKSSHSINEEQSTTVGSDSVPEQRFKLEAPITALSEHEIVTKVHDVWSEIVPAKKEQQAPISIKTPNFSLSLDPSRYPTFAKMDGGRIILDQNGTIPPLVKSLIEDKDSSLRIVSEPPSGTKQFMRSLLGAAGFYSVEENYSMEFGYDPKLSVKADFKVEKTPESLINQDVLLLNSSRRSLPPTLNEFLKKGGFTVYEPFASLKPFAQRDSRTIHYISANNQSEMIDSILSAFAVSSERNRNLDVFAAENNGISLSVNAERYFERAGKRFVVTSFDGDPVNYTLFRILETKGYNVVILEASDDFKKVAEKIISRMKIKGLYARHNLIQDKSSGYSLQMSGFKLDDSTLPGGGIFLTDRAMDRIFRDLVSENGFSIK
ncbi:MAG: LysM peptidoglycan-binding domain-containing protein [Desulfuromonadaceae bacterium]|nr:LysM peptidoglycan-binding domain-containing protein [Desulfuromonadaceae bacterium]MDD2855513.1 LysM peptidoglycan-binding domain-containing protein [Desulfuromonadaceae bacterium]